MAMNVLGFVQKWRQDESHGSVAFAGRRAAVNRHWPWAESRKSGLEPDIPGKVRLLKFTRIS